jgi:hypothetical protein
MKSVHHDNDSENWTSEGWTGEQDAVAAIALAVCLAGAALIFLLVAAAELHP